MAAIRLMRCHSIQYAGLMRCHSMQYAGLMRCHNIQYAGLMRCHNMQYAGLMRCHSIQYAEVMRRHNIQCVALTKCCSIQYVGLFTIVPPSAILCADNCAAQWDGEGQRWKVPKRLNDLLKRWCRIQNLLPQFLNSFKKYFTIYPNIYYNQL